MATTATAPSMVALSVSPPAGGGGGGGSDSDWDWDWDWDADTDWVASGSDLTLSQSLSTANTFAVASEYNFLELQPTLAMYPWYREIAFTIDRTVYDEKLLEVGMRFFSRISAAQLKRR